MELSGRDGGAQDRARAGSRLHHGGQAPAEDTPLTSLALVRLAEEAGFRAGTINIVTASRAHTLEVVDVWLADARVRKITFTGSTPVGKHLAREPAPTLKKLSLELGGNAPFIVFEDAQSSKVE